MTMAMGAILCHYHHMCTSALALHTGSNIAKDSLSISISTPSKYSQHNLGIGSLKSCKNINEIRQIHTTLVKIGIHDDSSTLTELVSSYAKMGVPKSLECASKAFEIFAQSGGKADGHSCLFMFNSLIRGCFLSGDFVDAILLFIRMIVEGISPDRYSFLFVLKACTKGMAFFEGVQIHGSIVKMGSEDVFIQNSLIHFYCEAGKFNLGKKVFDGMCERNVVSWTSLICGYARSEKHREAVSLFFRMIRVGIEPNSVSIVSTLSACAKLRALDLGEKVCACIGNFGVEVNPIMVNALVDMYMKCGAMDKAKRHFDECIDKNLILYNTVLSNYVRQGKMENALGIMNEMLQQGKCWPDRVTLLSAMFAATELNDPPFGKQCHAFVLRNGLDGWDCIGNALIDMYMKYGKEELACRVFDQTSNKTLVSWNSMIVGFVRNDNMESARKIFNEMPKRDLISWNTIIGACVQESLFEEAIKLFRLMQISGIKADKVTMVSVASACGYLGVLDLAKWTYSYIKINEIPCDVHLGTSLVDMFARCGDTQSAIEVFNNMKDKDVFAWTAAIGAMAMEGNGQQAVELFDKMLMEEVQPDGVVFVTVLTACSHGGLVGQGKRIFNEMKNAHGVSPLIVHYGCMVDLLGRAGLLDEALDLIRGMEMEPNDVIWGAFLAACRMHKHEKMATYAENMITESVKDRTGINVLLSNIYASVGKWVDVARVRMHMKEKEIRKVPGSSSIVVNGIVHEFTSGDESHADQTVITLMLDEMNGRLKDAGHVPDLANVLMDVNKQEKEYLIGHHSEKLAIAYGLISTSQGVPIRVVKNLRMCTDCHSFAKLVSKLYVREIIVRDNNRFHFFRGGFCSCNDYW